MLLQVHTANTANKASNVNALDYILFDFKLVTNILSVCHVLSLIKFDILAYLDSKWDEMDNSILRKQEGYTE